MRSSIGKVLSLFVVLLVTGCGTVSVIHETIPTPTVRLDTATATPTRIPVPSPAIIDIIEYKTTPIPFPSPVLTTAISVPTVIRVTAVPTATLDPPVVVPFPSVEVVVVPFGSPTPEPPVAATATPTSTSPPIPATPIPTATPTPIPTATPVPTATPTPIPTATPVPTATPTPIPTATPVPTATPTPIPTATPVPTATPTPNLASLHNTTNTRWLSQRYPLVADSILEFQWAEDGLSDKEKELIDRLLYLGVSNIDHLKTVIEMPFLDSLEAMDSLVVRSMYRLSKEELFREVLGHPRVKQDSDTWASLVVATGTIRNPTKDKVERLLNIAKIEIRSAETKHTPLLKASIVRTGEAKPGTIELVFNAASTAEEVMGMPLPNDHIVLVMDENSVLGGFAGRNYGFAIAYHPKYEDPTDSWAWRHFEVGLIHETAHYYWRDGEMWINEGMANITEYIYNLASGLTGSQLKPLRKKCEAPDLETLTQWSVGKSNSQYLCNYYMGETLFVALMEGDPDGFRDKMHQMHSLLVSAREDKKKAGIEEVRQVFSDQLDIVEHYWSGKWNAPENRDPSEGIDRISHHMVEWDEYPAYNPNSKVVSLRGSLRSEAVLYAPNISVARRGGPQNFVLYPFDDTAATGSILPYFDDGRTSWDTSNYDSVVTSRYDITEQTFHVEFTFPDKLGDPTGFVVTIQGYLTAERKPRVGTRSDNLGYARIRLGD